MQRSGSESAMSIEIISFWQHSKMGLFFRCNPKTQFKAFKQRSPRSSVLCVCVSDGLKTAPKIVVIMIIKKRYKDDRVVTLA